MNHGNLDEKFATFAEHWRPKIVAELNGQEVKLAKFQGTFVWHRHEAVDEMFLVWRGEMRVEFRDRIVKLRAGEFLVIARGEEHRTAADHEAHALIFEPADTRNSGDVADEKLTAPLGARI